MAGSPRPRRAREINLRWHFVAVVTISFLRIFGKYRWHHQEKVPAEGAFILAPNHLSQIDVLIMGWLVVRRGRVPRFLAKSTLFTVPGLGWVLKFLGQIPVERKKGAGGASLERAAELINEGIGVIVYPEGTLTRDPGLWPMRGRPGAARLALEYGIPVIPVAHWGAQHILPRYAKALRGGIPRKRVEVLVGDPVDLSRWAGRKDARALAEATDEIMRAITALLAELRGEEPPARRWNPAEHGQPEMGRFEPPPSLPR